MPRGVKSTCLLPEQKTPIHEFVFNTETEQLEHREYYRWAHVGNTRVTPDNFQRVAEKGNRLFRFHTKSSSRLINECDLNMVKNHRLLTFDVDMDAIKKEFIKHYENDVIAHTAELDKARKRLYAMVRM